MDYPPETLWENFQASQRINRLVGSVQFNHRPRTWFNQRLTLGLDITGEDNLELARVPNQAARQFLSSPTDLGGGKSVFRNDFNTATIDYAANAKANISSTIKSTSSVGVQYFRRRRYLLSAAGAGFPAAGLENINATTTSFSAGEDLITNVTFGVFAQEELDYKERLYLTFALRASRLPGRVRNRKVQLRNVLQELLNQCRFPRAGRRRDDEDDGHLETGCWLLDVGCWLPADIRQHPTSNIQHRFSIPS